jgi:hypothetical protein
MSGDMGFSMFGGMDDGMMPIILPAKDIIAVAQQAPAFEEDKTEE